MVQVALIFGLWKRIRPILIFWIVVECLTTFVVFCAFIAATVLIGMIPGTVLSLNVGDLYRALIVAGAEGAAAPVNFEQQVHAPVNFQPF